MSTITELAKSPFVLARFDRDPSLVFQVFFYDESPYSKPITLEGRNGVAIGVSSHWSVQKALKEGWSDVTKKVKMVSQVKPVDLDQLSEALPDSSSSVTEAKTSSKDTIVIGEATKTKAKPKPKARKTKRK